MDNASLGVISFTGEGVMRLEEETNDIIDFDDINSKQTTDVQNEDFPDENGDDTTRNLQFPLLSTAIPPTKIPKQYVQEMWFQSPLYVNLRCRFLASDHAPFQCGTIPGFLGVYHERMRHFTSFPYMIHPCSDFITIWDFVIGLILAVNMVYSPYLIAFHVQKFVTQPVLGLNMFMSIALLVDVMLNFITGVRDKYTGCVQFEPKIVMWNYMKGWFLYDAITRAPIDAILTYELTEEERMHKTNLEVIRIVAFVARTLRYRKMFEILSRISNILSVRSTVTQWAIKMVTLVLYLVHWMACLQWLLPDIVNARLNKPKPKSWVTAYGLWNKSEFVQYINSYLRSLSNLLTLDGGANTPRETEEIFTTIIGVLVNVSIFGYFLSSFTNILRQTSSSSDKYDSKFDAMHEYLTFKKIPLVLQEKVMTYFEKKHQGHMFSDAAILSTLSPTLRAELSCHNCRNLVEKVPIFQKVSAGVIVSLVEKLEYDVYVPGDVLVTAETQGDAMFFIQSGELHELDSFGNQIRSLRDGEFFGEMALITNQRTRETVVAAAACEVYKLSKANFKVTVENCPEVYNRITEVCKEKLEAERKLLEEGPRRAQEMRNWKNAKKEVEESIKLLNNEPLIDTTGIELIGGVTNESKAISSANLGKLQKIAIGRPTFVGQFPTSSPPEPEGHGMTQLPSASFNPPALRQEHSGIPDPATSSPEELEENTSSSSDDTSSGTSANSSESDVESNDDNEHDETRHRN